MKTVIWLPFWNYLLRGNFNTRWGTFEHNHDPLATVMTYVQTTVLGSRRLYIASNCMDGFRACSVFDYQGGPGYLRKLNPASDSLKIERSKILKCNIVPAQIPIPHGILETVNMSSSSKPDAAECVPYFPIAEKQP